MCRSGSAHEVRDMSKESGAYADLQNAGAGLDRDAAAVVLDTCSGGGLECSVLPADLKRGELVFVDDEDVLH